MTLLERRNPNSVYHLMSVSDFKKSTPKLNFDAYLSGLGISDIKEINVHQPLFFAELNKMLNDVSIEDINKVKPLQPLLLCLEFALKADAHEGGDWTRGDDNQRYNMVRS